MCYCIALGIRAGENPAKNKERMMIMRSCETLIDRVEQQLGGVTGREIAIALPLAMDKLERIIAREGDDDGERLKPYYIAQLVAEQIRSDRAEAYFAKANQKSAGAIAPNALQSTVTILAQNFEGVKGASGNM